MPTLLQINATSNWGSTGRIVEQIGTLAVRDGWDCVVAWGRYSNPSAHRTIRIGNKLTVYEHYLENRLLDNEGRASRRATREFLREVDRIAPDVVHLHNIHDHYLNYEALLRYLKAVNVPVVWTQHDCWAFTGGCMHYSWNGCLRWRSDCGRCPYHKGLFNHSAEQFARKRALINSLDRLTLVPVSQWLGDVIGRSFLRDLPREVICNGVDLNVFQPITDEAFLASCGLSDRRYVLGVATAWHERKGLRDFARLAEILDPGIRIVLVGVPDRAAASLPPAIQVLPRTHDQRELAVLYTGAQAVLNLSYEETFGLTTAEGFACGTPSVVYDATSSPELIGPGTGTVVPAGNIPALKQAVEDVCARGRAAFTAACRDRAATLYDRDRNYARYIDLYHRIR